MQPFPELVAFSKANFNTVVTRLASAQKGKFWNFLTGYLNNYDNLEIFGDLLRINLKSCKGPEAFYLYYRWEFYS